MPDYGKDRKAGRIRGVDGETLQLIRKAVSPHAGRSAFIVDGNQEIAGSIRALFPDVHWLSSETASRIDYLFVVLREHFPMGETRNQISLTLPNLDQGGTVVLVGKTRQGVVRIADHVRDVLRDNIAEERTLRGKQGLRAISFLIAGPLDGLVAPVVNLATEVNFDICGRSFKAKTAPGVFSREHLDGGTRLLLERSVLTEGRHILDLGCGWGAISLVVGVLNPSCDLTLLDNDSRSLALAKENMQAAGLSERSSCVRTFDELTDSRPFDLVLSNPPFHASEEQLHQLFTETRRRTVSGARIAIVVEQTYVARFERLLGAIFGNCEKLDVGQGFFVLSAARVGA